jgi:Tol biopolymer transport system component
MNADGSEQTKLFQGFYTGFPDWSLDGTHIVFHEVQGIKMMNSDGSGVVLVREGHWSIHKHPSWSPDGQRIAFAAEEPPSNWEIFVTNVDGSGLTRLTNNSAWEGDPAWSPDGQHIAFVSDGDGNYEIYVMNADGTNAIRLTVDLAYDGEPSWSSDGTRIVFVSDRDGNKEIYMMRADGGGQTNLTNNPGQDWAPAWSPK